MKKKWICRILLAALLLTGCSNSTPKETETVVPETTVSEQEETLFIPDDLPDSLDFEGKKVGVSIGNYNNAYWADLYSESTNGNRMNDAVYSVITGVEERLNVDLNYSSEDFVYDELGAYKTKILGNIMAGDDSIGLIIGLVNFAGNIQNSEAFLNLADTPYIDIEKPWYNHTIIENMPNDNIYFLSGSFALTNIKYCFGMYFNNTLMQTMNITEDPYALVDAGKWTLDTMNNLVTNTYADLDGNGEAGLEDRYGLSFGGITYSIGFMSALEVKMFEKVDNGYQYTYGSERAAAAVQKLCSIVHENPSVYPAKWNDDPSHMSGVGGTFISRIFVEGRSLFTCDTLANAPAILADIDFEYGLLPYPKWDESQNQYKTQLQRSGYALIPSTADPEVSSAVLEALSSASYRTLIPEYFEETLKTRYSPDNNASRMYDLIYSGVVYDPGVIFEELLGDPNGEFYMAVFNNDTNWASKSAAMEERLQNLIDSLLE